MSAVPRLTYLRIKNYRALRDVEFRDLTPLTVLIGPNGSGKSTVLDALDFLAEAVRGNLQDAWNSRQRFEGMRTKGSRKQDAILFELEFQTEEDVVGYKIGFNEFDTVNGVKIFIDSEVITDNKNNLLLTRLTDKYFGASSKQSFYPFLNEYRFNFDASVPMHSIPDYTFLTSVNTGNDERGAHLRAIALTLNEVLSSYRLTHLTDDHLKGYSDAGPRERISPNGDNLPNVLYHLHLKHPEVLALITEKLKSWVPKLADVVPEMTSDKRILLRFRDAPGDEPLPARYMSGGTMRLAALLTLLYEPDAAGLLGIEEPENELYPHLLYLLAEELGKATEQRQLLVATHSPFLLDALAPEQVWILHRGSAGYTQATRAADIPNVKELVEDGSPLGYLWTSNSLTVADPLAPAADAR